MYDKDFKRISRLTAILTQLQTRRLLTATFLADKFGVSVRTIYRDIRALEEAGVPVLAQEGKGYSLLEGYRLPPVMFTESEANALVLAEKLVARSKDASFIRDYADAVGKVRSVLSHRVKDKVELLSRRTISGENLHERINSDTLSELQMGITNYSLVRIDYCNQAGESSIRCVEPFAIIRTENWLLIAWCRLRGGFRYFRLDRILKMQVLEEKFSPHELTLMEFFKKFS